MSYYDIYGFDDYIPKGNTVSTGPVSEQQIGQIALGTNRRSTGRRMRVFASLFRLYGTAITTTSLFKYKASVADIKPVPTYQEWYDMILSGDYPEVLEYITNLKLRTATNGDKNIEDQVYLTKPQGYETKLTQGQVDPSLHPALQDLATELVQDLREALATLVDPDHYYPGVDEGIEPVPDEHVELVLWATQRELDRETRKGRPAAQLSELDPQVQRAFVERRRLRYTQYGIGKREWETNTWSVLNIQEDTDWLPR